MTATRLGRRRLFKRPRRRRLPRLDTIPSRPTRRPDENSGGASEADIDIVVDPSHDDAAV